MDNHRISSILGEIAFLLEVNGARPDLARAYHKAARTIKKMRIHPREFKSARDLARSTSIAPQISEGIWSLITIGCLPLHQNLIAETPHVIMDMAAIRGLTPKKVRIIFEYLSIENLTDLEIACIENQVAGVPGIGPRTQSLILKGIHELKKFSGHVLLDEGVAAAESLRSGIEGISGIRHVETAGFMRRSTETVRNITLVVSTEHPKPVLKAFCSHPLVRETYREDDDSASVILHDGIQAHLHTAGDEEFASTLIFRTGSDAHVANLMALAANSGFNLCQKGLFREGSGRAEPAESEKAIYNRLGLQWIPPEIRENEGEIEAARLDAIPRLIECHDIYGAFHIHTCYSDGENTIREYIEEAGRLGWEYIGISDHSRSADYAGGLTLEALERQRKEIDLLNAEQKDVRVFAGIESDILPDGSLDYPDEVLDGFDFIIASVHSQMNMNREAMTKRVLRAICNPRVTMLGHPTGRLLLEREPYQIDIEEVIQAAARHGVIIELNANPCRLDINWQDLKKAVRAGVMTSINPDAHRISNLDYVRLGTGVARKAWCGASHVFNARPLNFVADYLEIRKRSV